MTFGFSKSPIFAHFQAILIFETKKVIIWFHFKTFDLLFDEDQVAMWLKIKPKSLTCNRKIMPKREL